MALSKQEGFSLIEILIVVVILGILAGITFPYLLRAKSKSENGNAYATTRTIFSSQITFYTANGRYARLDELNAEFRNGLGTIDGSKLLRGPFVFEMSPQNPTDADLKDKFTIFISKPDAVGPDAYSLSLDASGRIVENPPE